MHEIHNQQQKLLLNLAIDFFNSNDFEFCEEVFVHVKLLSR